MIQSRRQHTHHRSRDILLGALKSLQPTDEIICSLRTYRSIAPRIEDFRQQNHDARIVITQSGPIKRIRKAN